MLLGHETDEFRVESKPCVLNVRFGLSRTRGFCGFGGIILLGVEDCASRSSVTSSLLGISTSTPVSVGGLKTLSTVTGIVSQRVV